MHIKWRQFFREVNSPSVTVFPFWSLIDKEASMLLHNGWKKTADTDSVAAHDDWNRTTVFVQDICSHASGVACAEFENVTDFDPTCKVQDPFPIWWDLAFTNFTNIDVFCSKVTSWVDTSQVVACFIGTDYCIAAVLDLAVCDNLNIFRKINWTERAKICS